MKIRSARFEKVSKDEYIKTTPAEFYDNIKMPLRATSGSAGYDFFAPYPVILPPGGIETIATGIRCFIDPGYVLMLFPRSGLGFRYGMRLSNTVGVIDSDYYSSSNEGHIFIKIINPSDRTVRIEEGQGFAQGVFLPYALTYDDNADGLRDGGFGSTDEK